MMALQSEIREYQKQSCFWQERLEQASQLVYDSQKRLSGYKDRLIELRTDPKYKADVSSVANKFRHENSLLGNLLATEQYCKNKVDYNRRIVDYLEFFGG